MCIPTVANNTRGRMTVRQVYSLFSTMLSVLMKKKEDMPC